MSADNGFILRQRPRDGKYVLQEYCASVDELPPIDAEEEMVYSSVEEAVLAYSEMLRCGLETEYGLKIDLESRTHKFYTSHGHLFAHYYDRGLARIVGRNACSGPGYCAECSKEESFSARRKIEKFGSSRKKRPDA